MPSFCKAYIAPSRAMVVLSVLGVVGLFWIGFDCRFGQLYAPFNYHRLQVNALLEGHLSLGSDIAQIDDGLTWYNGQIHQVWGLGVPLWLTPFECLSRMFGARGFPDRLALLAALALTSWYAFQGGIAVGRALRNQLAGFSTFLLIMLFPPLWNLTLGRKSIFEETILYACLVSTALLVGVIRFLICRSRLDFWIVCTMSGLSGLVRVTHGTYGVFAALLCGTVLLFSPKPSNILTDRRRLFEPLLGFTMFLAGFGFLAYTNNCRFGTVIECGHRLTNIDSAEVLYITRFGNPFLKAGLLEASMELFSWMFLSPFSYEGVSGRTLLPWQASPLRWRGIEQPTFDLSYFFIFIATTIVATAFVYRRLKLRRCFSLHPVQPIQNTLTGLVVWSIGNILVIGAFYLYVPLLTTRYILDFSPAFAGVLVLFILLFSPKWPRLAPSILLIWLSWQSTSLWLHRDTAPGRSLAKNELHGLPVLEGVKLPAFNGTYSIAKHPAESNILYNGRSWHRDGIVAPVVMLALDRPQFLEILVSERRSNGGSEDIYRAKLNNLELEIESEQVLRQGTNTLKKIRFHIPAVTVVRNEAQLVFISFVAKWDEGERESQRYLYEVHWR